MSGVTRMKGYEAAGSARASLSDPGFALTVLVVESLTILALSIATGACYHLAAYGDVGQMTTFVGAGLIAAIVYIAPGLHRNEYLIEGFLARGRRQARVFVLWNTAFLVLAVVAFISKTTGLASRAWAGLFYVSGLVALTALEYAMCRLLDAGLRSGRIIGRRAFVVGASDELRQYGIDASRAADPRVVGTLELPRSGTGKSSEEKLADLAERLATGVSKARMLGADVVVLLPSCDKPGYLQPCMDAFGGLPVSIQLALRAPLQTCRSVRLAEAGGHMTLSLTEAPLTPWQDLVKRGLDVALALVAIVILAPLFVATAFMIKRDSKGPVFFRQRRRGFNQREFRIWKFRTMTTMDDGDNIVQAQKFDTRVTKIGAYLRRFNIDELPQLFNVLSGEMSLVGPRPHAVAHDRLFETRITDYPRRLNMRPGITGWAQVNGFRGVTDTEEKMRGRVEHDVYYIANWSILFDLYILALTVVSPKAYKNAH